MAATDAVPGARRVLRAGGDGALEVVDGALVVRVAPVDEAEKVERGAVGGIGGVRAFQVCGGALQISELVVRDAETRLQVGQIGVALGRALVGLDGARRVVLLAGGQPGVIGRTRVVGLRPRGRFEGELRLRVRAGLQQLEPALEFALRARGARGAHQQEQGERRGHRARHGGPRARGGGTDAAAR